MLCYFDRNQSALLNRKLPQGDLLQKTSELYIHSNKTSQTEQKTGLSLHFFFTLLELTKYSFIFFPVEGNLIKARYL